jgi:hypothetical protein
MPLFLDVTNAASIASALEQIAQAAGLAGLAIRQPPNNE